MHPLILHSCFRTELFNTTPKFNILDPENWWLEDYFFLLGKQLFKGYVKFRGGVLVCFGFGSLVWIQSEFPNKQASPRYFGAPGPKMDTNPRSKSFVYVWNMGVSKNRGTPKSSILIGFSIIFTIHFGGFPPIFGNNHIFLCDRPVDDFRWFLLISGLP